MAPNRQSQVEAAASSSEEEYEGSSSEEHEEQEESEDEEEEEGDKTSPSTLPKHKKPSASKKPGTSQTPAHRPSSSDDDDDTEPGYASDSDAEDTVLPNVKPVASKSMKEPAKATKKPRSKPSAAASATTPKSSTAAAAKRPNEGEANRESKKAKKIVSSDAANGVSEEGNGKKTGEDSKKQLFQRVWSFDDELAVLKGIIEYAPKKGADPLTDMNAFYEFMNNRLQNDVTKTQLYEKVRRLKKKYTNNASKGKNGEDRTFSNAHEQKAYELSKKIWGLEANNGGLETPKVKAKAKKNQDQRSSKPVTSLKVDEPLSGDGQKEATKMEVEQNALASSSSVWGNGGMGSLSLEEEIIRDGIELVKGAKRSELEEKWKQLRVEEVELYLRRVDLIREQTKLVLEALKSPGH